MACLHEKFELLDASDRGARRFGEEVVLAALAGGTTAASGLALPGRAKPDMMLRWLRRR